MSTQSQLPSVQRPPLRVNNVSRRFGVDVRTVRYWLAKGYLHGRKIDGKSWGIDVAEVKRFQAARAEADRDDW
jgi:hypothetical protein